MGKRGVANIVEAILGILLIVIVLFAMGAPAIEYAKDKFFKEGKFQPPWRKGEFTPYTTVLSPEEQSVDYSMKGLTCAINSMALGKAEVEDGNVCPSEGKVILKQNEEPIGITGAFIKFITGRATEEGEKGDKEEKKEDISQGCDGQVRYGNICVKCSGGVSKGVVVLKDSKDKATESLAYSILDCWNLNYPGNEDFLCNYLDISSLEKGITITSEDLSKWLVSEGSHAALDLSGKGMINRIGFTGGLKINNELKNYCVSYDGNNVNNIYVGVCDNEKYKKMEISCIVKGFELPQKIEKKGLLNPLDWVAGHNDPDYIVYYEAFPKGPEKFWHVDAISVVSVSLVFGFAAFDIVPVVGKGIGTAFKKAFKKGAEETIKTAAEKGIRTGLREFFETVTKTGWKRTLKKTVTKESFTEHYGVVDDISKEAVEYVDSALGKISFRKVTEEQLGEELYQKVGKKIANIPDDFKIKYAYETASSADVLVEEVLSQPEFDKLALDAYRRKVSREMAEKGIEIYSKEVTEEVAREWGQKLALKYVFRGMFKENLEELNKEEIEILVKNTFLKFNAISSREQKEAVEKGAKLASEFLDEDELLDFVKITGKSFDNLQYTKKEFTAQFLDAIDTKEGNALADAVSKTGGTALTGVWKGTFGPTNPLKDPLKFFGDQIPVSLNLLKTPAKMAKWVKDHKYPVIVAIAFYAAANDAVTEKFESVGMNSVGVDRPYLLGEPISYKLIDEASKYYIVPKVESENAPRRDRFYLASPCKANLILKTGKCLCKRRVAGTQHFVFEESAPPIDAKGLELDEDKMTNDKLLYEKFKELRQNNPRITEPEEKVVSDIKSSLSQQKDKELIEKYKQYYITDIEKISTREEAIAAYYKTHIINFYDTIVSGFYIDDTEYIKKVELPMWSWEEMKYFYDFNGVTKECYSEDFIQTSFELLKMAFKEDVPIEENRYAKTNYKPSCMSVTVQRQEGWNNDVNYCIDEYPGTGLTNTIRYTLFAAEVALSIFATAGTGGLAAPFAIVGSGIISGLAEEWLARQSKWPSHHDQGATGKVPIAQTALSDAELSALGGPR